MPRTILPLDDGWTFSLDGQHFLAVRLDHQFHITYTLGYGHMLTLALQTEDIRHIVAQVRLPEGEEHLRPAADREGYSFFCGNESGYVLLGSVSTRFLATELSGRCFTGTAIGLYTACDQPMTDCMRVTAFLHGPGSAMISH